MSTHFSLNHLQLQTPALSFQSASTGNKGRFLQAVAFLPAGEEVLVETPLIILPAKEPSCFCLNCLRPLPGESDFNAGQTILRCPQGCGLAYCSRGCFAAAFGEGGETILKDNSKSGIKTLQKHVLECAVLKMLRCIDSEDGQRAAIKLSNDMSLRFLLRAAAVRLESTQSWDALLWLESHMGKREPAWREERLAALAPLAELIRSAGVPCVADLSTEDLVYIDCVREVNAFEFEYADVMGLSSTQPHQIVFLCNRLAMLQHSCRPNCRVRLSLPGSGTHSNTSCAHVSLRTLHEIQPGETLTIAYIPLDWPQTRRQETLLRTKFFSCDCARCGQELETGDHLGAPRCPQGCIEAIPVRGLRDGFDWEAVSNSESFSSDTINRKVLETNEESEDKNSTVSEDSIEAAPLLMTPESLGKDLGSAHQQLTTTQCSWVCSNCGTRMFGEDVSAMNTAFEEKIQAAGENLAALDDLLEECEEKWGHPSHYLVFRCLFALALALRHNSVLLAQICTQALSSLQGEESRQVSLLALENGGAAVGDLAWADERRPLLRAALGEAMISNGSHAEGVDALMQAFKAFAVLQGLNGPEARALSARIRDLSE